MAQRSKLNKTQLGNLKAFCKSERQTEILEALIVCDCSYKKAGRQIGVNPSQISRAVHRIERNAFYQNFSNDPDHAMQHPIADTQFLKGNSTYYDKDGKVRGQWVKTNAKLSDMLEHLRDFAEGLGESNVNGFKRVKTPKATDAELLTVYPLADLHLGMLAWSAETREDFDTAIASDALRLAASILTEKAPPSKQAIIANIGDFFHFDNDNKMTSSGNILDVDSRWSNVIHLGVDCLLHFIKLALEKHETVKVINSLGNHDGQSALMLPFILKPYFANEPRVIIEDAPRIHHYHIFGATCLGFHHGHKTPASRLCGCMTADQLTNPNVDTSDVEFCHWLTGHIHHEKVDFPGGMLVESFRTLAAKDAYHSGAGYRALRDMQTVTYHRDFGECDRSRCSYKLIQHHSKLPATRKSTKA